MKWRAAFKAGLGIVCAVVLAGYASAAESPPAVVGSLQVLAPPAEVAIDPQSSSGSTVLELKNVGEKDIVALPLRAGDFVSTVTKRKLGSRLSFAAGSDTAGTVAYSLDLAAGKTATLELLATGVWDAGEAKAPVFVDGKPLLEVSARKQPVPFNVKLGTGKEPVAIDWDSKRLVLRIENADALNYRFNWRLVVDGTPLPKASGAGVLPASGSSQIDVAFAEDRFPDCLPGLFRPKPVAGTLLIEYADPTDTRPGPQRSLPVLASLERHQATTRTIAGGFVVFVLLLAGGVTSLLLNHSLPNATRRVGLRGQLGALSVKAKALGASIPPMLRTELRVRPLELTQRVDAEHSFYPGAVDILDAAAREASTLERRLGLVAKIDECLRRTETMGSDGPPELLHDDGALGSAAHPNRDRPTRRRPRRHHGRPRLRRPRTTRQTQLSNLPRGHLRPRLRRGRRKEHRLPASECDAAGGLSAKSCADAEAMALAALSAQFVGDP